MKSCGLPRTAKAVSPLGRYVTALQIVPLRCGASKLDVVPPYFFKWT